MTTTRCLVCNGFNELEATQCAHCGTRIVDIGKVEWGKPIVLRMCDDKGALSQVYIPRLELESWREDPYRTSFNINRHRTVIMEAAYSVWD